MPGPYQPLVDGWKSIAGIADWSPPDTSDRAMTFTIPLDIDGVTVEGLFLRARTYEQSLNRDVMFQMELAPTLGRERVPLLRIDWLPRARSHKNPDKTQVFGSHFHTFEGNWLEQEQRMRTGSLPYAEAVPQEVGTYGKLLDFARERFRIRNMDTIPIPEWSMTMFS